MSLHEGGRSWWAWPVLVAGQPLGLELLVIGRRSFASVRSWSSCWCLALRAARRVLDGYDDLQRARLLGSRSDVF